MVVTPSAMEHLRRNATEFELRAQLCFDLETMPVGNASMAWPEDCSDYVAVTRTAVSAQDIYSPARRAHYSECCRGSKAGLYPDPPKALPLETDL